MTFGAVVQATVPSRNPQATLVVNWEEADKDEDVEDVEGYISIVDTSGENSALGLPTPSPLSVPWASR